jgi:superfamily II DNA or RNA helicase
MTGTSGARTLTAIPFATTYRKGDTDIATDFLVPCFHNSIRYDRAVGYFSSAVYAVAWPGLRDFLARGGTMRMLCSPRLTRDDARAIRDGHQQRSDVDITRALIAELEALLAATDLQEPTIILATLVALKKLDLRFVNVAHDDSGRFLFHDKAGVFADGQGQAVLFKGSMNETWAGVSSDGNLESIDVFVSWGDSRESQRVAEHQTFFEALWLDLWPPAKVYSPPEAFRKQLLQIADADHLDERIDRMSFRTSKRDTSTRATGRTPLRHQMQAITGWLAAGRRGILEHATGSGKTVTALLAIKDAVRRGETPIVLVPSVLLLTQWEREARAFLGADVADIVTCGAGNDTWRSPGVLAAWTRPTVRPPLILATMDTAASEQFRARVRGGPHIFVVADEVHRLGSTTRSNALQIEAGPRLGLSATPVRAGDAEGTERLLQWFGPVLQPTYGIGDAIRDGRLCRYFYRVQVARLTADELKEWNDLTRRLVMLHHAKSAAASTPDDPAKLLLLKRARILKQAQDKLNVAQHVLSSTVRPGDRWLVYCDSVQQLSELRSRLGQSLPSRVFEYYRGMPGDGSTVLRLFTERGGVVLAIRCLDEGVDIPAADHALIIASSQNPREFIQRRGRVLRHAPRKAFAVVQDIVVLPPPGAMVERTYPFIYAEVARAMEFAQYSENPSEIDHVRSLLAQEGVDPATLHLLGIEDDDNERTDDKADQ